MGGRPMAGRERRCRRNLLRCCAGRVLLVRAASRRDGPGGAPPTNFAALGGSWAARGYRGTCELSLSTHGRTRITASSTRQLPESSPGLPPWSSPARSTSERREPRPPFFSKALSRPIRTTAGWAASRWITPQYRPRLQCQCDRRRRGVDHLGLLHAGLPAAQF